MHKRAQRFHLLRLLGMIVGSISLLTANAQVQRLSYHGPNSYNISSGQFNSTFSVENEEALALGMAFNNDGTKLYVIGYEEEVNEYDLSVAYDVSTGIYVDNFSVTLQETIPSGMAFNNDGSKLYVVGESGEDVNEYDLSVAYDVSTGIYVDNFSVTSEVQNPQGMAFNHDGTKLYVVGLTGSDVNEYDLSVAYDVSTGTYVDNFSVTDEETSPRDMAFNHDGTKLYVVGNAGEKVNEYDLSVAYDVSTGTFADNFSVLSEDLSATGMAFNNDGTKLYVIGLMRDNVNEYDIDPGDYVEFVADDGSIDNSAPLVITLEGGTFQDADADDVLDVDDEVTIGNVPAGLTPIMTLSNSDQTVTLTFTGNATNHSEPDDVSDLTFVFADGAFTGNDASGITNSGDGGVYSSNIGIDFFGVQRLRYHGPNSYNTSSAQLSGTFSVTTQEITPTGIAFNIDGTKLYVVGNDGNDVNEYNLSVAYDVSTGIYVDNFSVEDQETTPHGMAFNHDGTKLYVIGFTGGVNEYDLSVGYDVSTGTFVDSFSVADQETIPTGMAFNHDGTKLYVIGSEVDEVNEYDLSVAYDVSTGTYVDNFSVAGQAPNGMAFNHDGTKLYVIGDDAEDEVYEYDLSVAYDVSTGSFVDNFSVDSDESNSRGMAFNNDGTKLYVVGLAGEDITEYDIDPGDYVEAVANDGSIDNSAPLVITLDGGTFQDADADDVLDAGSVTIGNVPAGLIPVMTLSNSDQTVTLTFTGTATNHQESDDVSDLTFIFNDGAFTGNDASAINNSGDGGAYSFNIGVDFITQRLSYHGPNSYNISSGQFSGTFSVINEETIPLGMAFNNDGTKLYVIGSEVDEVNEYDLSVAYDVSTGIYVDNFSVTLQETIPSGMAFNNDGSKLYVVGADGEDVNEYDLSVGYDVSTGIYVDNFSVADEETSPQGMAFNNDGTKLYVIGSEVDEVNEYDLSVAYDVSTGTYVDNFSVNSEERFPSGMAFNHDGTKLYVIGVQVDEVNEYDLSVAYDVSTGIHVDNFSVTDQETAPSGMAFNHDGTKLYVVGNGKNIREYDMVPDDYVELAADDGSIDNSAPLVITLEGDSFQDANADDVLDVDDEVTIGNVPAGLTPVMTLSNSDQTVILTFTGNATSHSVDVLNLTFVFADGAFTGNDASAITNSGDGGAYSSQVGIDFLDAQRLSYHGPNSYNTSSGQFNSTFSVTDEETSPTGMAFNNDGTKLYVIGSEEDEVNEYDLSVAYDVSTGTFVDIFSVRDQETSPQGMAFNDEGTKLYVIGSAGDDVNEYDLSVAYDVSTGTFVDSFSVFLQEDAPLGMSFNHDGTKLYVVGEGGEDVNEYDLSVAYDVSTGIYVDNFSVRDQETSPRGMAFNHDGSKLYVIGSDEDKVNEYDLSVAYDVSTGTFVDNFSVFLEEEAPAAMIFNHDGTKLYVVGNTGNNITEYDIDPGDYVEAASDDGSIDSSAPLLIMLDGGTFQDADADDVLDVGSEVTIGNVPAGLTPVMTLSNSNQTVTLTFTGNATNHSADVLDMTFVFADGAFTGNDASAITNSGDGGAYSSMVGIDFSAQRLSYHGPNSYNTSSGQLSGTFSVAAEETVPTGMAFNHDGTKLYVLGISNGMNEYDLSVAYDVSTGTFVDNFSVTEEIIPTGMAFNNDGTKLYVIGLSGNVNEYDLSVAYDVSTGTFVDNFSVTDQETSPTGMAFNHDGTKLYVIGVEEDEVNEYDLSVAYDVSTGTFVDNFSVTDQETSPRGMAFNHEGSKLYVIGSDEDNVNEYDLSVAYDVSTGIYVDNFLVDSEDTSPQGMAFNNDGTKLYVVGLTGDAVYEYDIDRGDYAEVADDGSIDNSAPLVITLEGGTFQDADADDVLDVLDVDDEVTIGNVPAGLTPIMTLSNSDQTVTLTFTGNASNHQESDDISDLTFVFDDSAFTGNDASVINNSGDGGVYSSNIGIAFFGVQRLSYHGPNSYNTSSGLLSGTFSVTTEEINPSGMAFNSDGTKLYVVGDDGDDVNEYDLSVAYDVSTGIYVDNFSVKDEEAFPQGIVFNHDGSKLYVVGAAGDFVNEYDLSVAYDVSTGTFVDNFSVNSEERNSRDMAFNHDGTKLYVIGNHEDFVNEYDLSEAYDVSTGTFVDNFSVLSEETSPQGMAFNHDGTKLYVVGNGGDEVNEYDLSVAYDVSTGTFVDNFSVDSEETSPTGMAFNHDGTKLYVVGNTGDAVYEYDIDPGDYVEAAVDDGSIDNSAPLVITLEGDTFQDADADDVLDAGSVTIGNVPAGLTPIMTLSNSDQTVTLTFTGNATNHSNDVSDLTFIFADGAFTGNDASLITNFGNGGGYSSNIGIDFFGVQRLSYHGPNSYNTSSGQLSGTFSVEAEDTEPHGIAFNNDGTKLYVVGDDEDDVNEYDLSVAYDVSTGIYVDNFSVTDQETFPTGMAFNDDGTKLYVVGISGGGVNEYDLSVAYDVSTGIYVDSFSVETEESTPAGMAFNLDGTKLYVVGISGGGVSEYDLSVAYDVSTGTFVDNFSIVAQETFPTGMAFNHDGTKLYVVGTIGDDVNEYDLSVAYDVSTGTFVDNFSVDSEEIAPLGIAFNHDGTKLYVVGNTGDAVYEYDIDPGDYVEAAVDDGSIDNSAPLVITLEGGTFQDADADDVLDAGSVTIGNVPAGLIPVMTLSNSDQTVTLTFTGNATNHQESDDVSDLTFVFDDDAFTGNDASAINNSGDGGVYSSNIGIDFIVQRLSYHGPNSYNTSSGQLSGTFSVTDQETTPTGMAFNHDGTKLYVVGNTGNAVYEYDLSVAYDVSTGTYVDNFSVTDDETSPRGMAFNHDGTKLYVIGVAGGDINEYDLSVAYDVSTGTFVDNFSVAVQETIPTGMAFNHDGTKLYVIGSQVDEVNEYDLSVAYDVSTGTFVDNFSFIDDETSPQGMAFNYDGTKLYVVGNTGNDVNEYDLSVSYDVSTGTFVDNFSVTDEETTPTGMAFNHDGTKLYVVGVTGEAVYEYDMDPGDYVEAASDDGSIDSSAPLVITLDGGTFQDANADDVLDVGSEVTIGNVPAGLTPVMTLSNSDQTVTLTFTRNATNHSEPDDISDLTFIFADDAFTGNDASVITNSGNGGGYSSNIGIDFFGVQRLSYHGPNSYNISSGQFNSTFSVEAEDTEPHAIAFNPDGTKLYVVGNSGNNIDEFDLSVAYDVSTGTYVDSFSVNLEETSPTGMAFNHDGTKLYVVGTEADNVNEYDLSVGYDVSTGTYVDNFSVATQETSPRDMAFNHDGTKLYVIGVKVDEVNEYDLSVAYDVSTGTFVDNFSVASEETDPQGMAFNHDGTKLYVIGSEVDEVNEYDLSVAYDVSTGTFVDNFSVASEETDPQGMAFNHDGTKLYVAGNDENDITEYDMDPGDYVEAAADDGSIDSSTPLVITLKGDTFQDADADDVLDVLDVDSEVTIGNVPAGLIPVMTLSNSDQTVTLTFTGNATNHQESADVSGLTFVFDDDAFTGNDASIITNSGDGGTYSSNIGIAFFGVQRLSYHGPNSYNISSGQLSGTFSVETEETFPLGMAFNNDGTKLYVVGDEGDDVNEYDLSVAYDVSTGTYVDNFSVSSEETMPTGMAFNDDGTKLYVIGFIGRDVNEYDLSVAYDVSTGTFVDNFSVAVQVIVPTGMAFNDDGTKLYVVGLTGRVNEYDLSVAYDVSTGTFVDNFSVSSEEAAPTGMAFNNDGTKLYVVGDTGNDVNEYDLSVAYDVSTGTYVDNFSVETEDAGPQGMAFNHDGTKLYVIGLAGDNVNEYDIDPGDYVEAATDDGSIDSSTPLVITLKGDTFQDADADDVLDVDDEVILGNVPVGLTPIMTLSNSDQTVTLTFTGNATDRDEPDGVSNLTFAFDDGAFTGNDALIITNSGDGGTYSSLVGVTFFGAPLPITLKSFTAQAEEGQVLVEWTTATEINNDFFTIERSDNGLDFYGLVEIDGAGNSSEEISYIYIDKNPLLDLNYYRLKQTDFNGSYEYSETILVRSGQTLAHINAFPNPTTNLLSIRGGTKVLIYDVFGALKMSKKLPDGSGNLELKKLIDGIYFIHITTLEGEVSVIKIIKNR